MTDRNDTQPPARPDGNFDPRFNPAFQPGYDPASDPTAGRAGYEAPRPSTGYIARPVPAADDRTVTAPAAPPATAAERPSTARPPRPASSRSPLADGDSDFDADFDADQAADVAEMPYPRNPFLYVLWAVSAVFVLGGVALLQAVPMLNARSQTASGFDSSYLYLQATIIGVPILISLGFATATAVLFLHAVEWRARRS